MAADLSQVYLGKKYIFKLGSDWARQYHSDLAERIGEVVTVHSSELLSEFDVKILNKRISDSSLSTSTITIKFSLEDGIFYNLTLPVVTGEEDLEEIPIELISEPDTRIIKLAL